jgi:hypothetical protein
MICGCHLSGVPLVTALLLLIRAMKQFTAQKKEFASSATQPGLTVFVFPPADTVFLHSYSMNFLPFTISCYSSTFFNSPQRPLAARPCQCLLPVFLTFLFHQINVELSFSLNISGRFFFMLSGAVFTLFERRHVDLQLKFTLLHSHFLIFKTVALSRSQVWRHLLCRSALHVLHLCSTPFLHPPRNTSLTPFESPTSPIIN